MEGYKPVVMTKFRENEEMAASVLHGNNNFAIRISLGRDKSILEGQRLYEVGENIDGQFVSKRVLGLFETDLDITSIMGEEIGAFSALSNRITFFYGNFMLCKGKKTNSSIYNELMNRMCVETLLEGMKVPMEKGNIGIIGAYDIQRESN